MTNDFQVTSNSSIDDWLLEARSRVSPWLITSEWLNNQFFADNPQCEAFIRPVFPNELPLTKSDEVWLVVIRRGQPDPAFIEIQTRLSPEQVLRNRDSMAELWTAYFEELGYTRPGTLAERLPLKIPASVYILDSQMRVITC
jgi:hypothetical protein